MVAPLVIWGIAGLVGARAVSNMKQADANSERAMTRNGKAFNKMATAQREVSETQEQVKQSLVKLANRKKGIINTSIKKFIKVYEVLQKIEFVQKKELTEFISRPLMLETVNVMNQAISVAGIECPDAEIVHSLLCLSITNSIVHDSERALKVARMRERQAEVIAEQTVTSIVALQALGTRAEEITGILTKLNQFFNKSIVVLDGIIKEKGTNTQLYTEQDYEYIMNCLNFADAVKKIIDAPIFDEEGKVTAQAEKALLIGDEYIQAMKKI